MTPPQPVFNLEEFLDVEQFTKEINEDISDLTAAMRTQTARSAYYGMLHSKAKKQRSTVDLTLKAIEAKLTTLYRKNLQEAADKEAEANETKAKPVTVDMVKAAVAIDHNYLAWSKVSIEAEEIEQICRIAYDAFRTRREMLQSLGHMTRAEMQLGIKAGQTSTQNIQDYRDRRAARQNGGADK